MIDAARRILVENNLTINEKNELETLEGIIGRSIGSFIAVGNALLTIRDQRLYRGDFKTFKDYCNDKWGMGKAHANRLISGSRVAANLAPRGDLCAPCEIQPTNEAQVRPLTILEPGQQCEVWEEAVRSADGKVVTYRLVKALVTELIGPAAPPTKEKDPHPESDAHTFVSMAIITLERIRDDDPRREEALNKLLNWINEKLREKPTRKSS
jgi:hypothetical protein